MQMDTTVTLFGSVGKRLKIEVSKGSGDTLILDLTEAGERGDEQPPHRLVLDRNSWQEVVKKVTQHL